MTTEHRRHFGPAGLSLPRSWRRTLAALGIVGLGFGTTPIAALAVVAGTSTTSVSSSSVSSVWGQSVALTATVTGSAAPNPSATVDFQADGVDIPGCGAVAVGGITNPTTAVCNTSGLTVATHGITAIYVGDPNYSGSGSPTLTQTVTQAASKGSGSVNVNPSVAGQPVTFQATEAAVGPGGGVPGGTVRFQADGADIAGCTASGLAFGLTSCTTNALGSGIHQVRALYGGDINFLGNNSPLVTQQVTQAATATAVTSSANPSVLGQPVTLTATVTATNPSTGVPTGTADFREAGNPVGSCSLLPLNSETATAACSLTAPSVATHDISVTYGGDANYTASTGSISQTVNPGGTTTALASDHAPADLGQTVTFTATVVAAEPSVGNVSHGTVTFSDGEVTIPGCSAQPVAAGGTTATCSTGGLGSGTHTIAATYTNTDGNFTGSSSAPLSQVIRFTTTTTVTSSTLSTIAGQTVTFTAAVTSGGPTPTGTVQFRFDGQPITCVTGPTPSTLDVTAHAGCDTAALSAGSHAITAVYNGDGNSMTGTSPAITQFVNPGNTVTTLGTSVNPVVSGQAVTFSAHVSAAAPAMGTPAGTVQFTAAGGSIPGCAAVTVTGGGDAGCTTSFMAGTDAVVAHYLGSGLGGSFEPSDSPTVSEQVNRAATTASVASSAAPSVSGQTVVYTATVSAVAPGTGTPGGTATFQDGGMNIGGCAGVALASGVATCSVAPPVPGGHAITAIYGGDANYNGVTSPTLTQTVNADTTTTVVTSSVSPSVTGQTVTYTATIAAALPGSGTPAGQVDFKDADADIGGCAAQATSATPGGATATCTVAYMTVGSGTHTISAGFTSSNETFSSSTSDGFIQSVERATTRTSATTSVDPSAFGQTVTFTATVTASGAGSGVPSGTAEFKADGVDIPSCGAQALVVGTATCAVSTLAVGTRPITVFYSGSLDYAPSNFGPGLEFVGKAGSTSTLGTGGSPSVYGQPVTFTDTVGATGPGSGTPSGNVEFKANGVDISGCASVAVADGTYSCTTSEPLPIGSDAITAIYPGDGNFAAGTSNTVTQTVDQASTTTAVTSSGTPSVTGQGVLYTATITPSPPATGTPTGTVRFQNGGIDIGTCTAVAIGTSGPLAMAIRIISPQGSTAVCAVTHTGVGTQAITAIYSGDANFLTSTSPGLAQVVDQDTTHTVLGSIPGPSVSGQPVTYTATVTADAPGGGIPLGSVAFLDGDVGIGGCATQPLSAGAATCQVTYASPGSHSISAAYSGNVNYVASATDGALTQVVGKAPTTTAVSAVPTLPAAGQPVIYTAAVTVGGGGSGTPTGTLAFTDSQSGTLPGCELVPLTAPTCGITYGSAGSHTITVTYSGDAGFTTSTSPPLTEAVGMAATAVALSADPNPSVSGQSVTFTATIAVTDPGAGTPTGTVTFHDGLLTIAGCESRPVGGGLTATCTTNTLAVGPRSVTATYNGDTDFSAGTSAATTQTVNQDSTTTVVTSPGFPPVSGQTVTYTATVTANLPGSGTPTGTVVFNDGGTPIAGCVPAPATLSDGVATCAVAYAGVGDHSITASYGGDSAFAGGTSDPLGQSIVQAATTTSVTANPTSAAVTGQPVTYTAHVSASAPGSGTPTGPVAFADAGTPIDACSAVPVGGEASALCTVTYAVPGTHTITASYGGDGDFTASASAAIDELVGKDGTMVTVASSANPAVSGEAVTYTATVVAAEPGSGLPSGTVTFSDKGTTVCTPDMPLDTGSATCMQTYAVPGAHDIDATYGGDASFTGADSATTGQIVNKAPTTAVVASNLSPSHAGAAVTLTVAVTADAPGSGVPTGSVNFKSDGTNIAGCTAAPLDGTGLASCTTRALVGGGTHAITGEYGGDGNYLSTTSSAFIQSVDSVNQGFVRQAYLDLLQRAADLGGLSYWTGRLDSGGLTRSEVALGILSGAEYRAIEVQSIFMQYLDRSADPGAQVGYQAQIAHGASDQSIAAQLAASDDYYNSQGGGTNIGFVSVLYQDALGRTPDKGGLDYWTGRLAAGVSRGQVAASFINEFEGAAHAVSGWYPQFLGRAGDSGGVAYWATQIVHGRSYEQVIAAGFIGSAEYLGRVGL